MNDYANSLEKIIIRDRKPDELITKEEMKIFRKYVRNLSW